MVSTNLYAALHANINILCQQLGRDDITITEVSGADIFYTDGAASGASFKLNPFGLYYKADGSKHYCWSADVTDEILISIQNWIQTIKNL